MDRRGFIALLAGVLIIGALTVLAVTDDDKASPDKGGSQPASAPAKPPPVPPIDPRHAALLVMDYQPAWIKTLPDPIRFFPGPPRRSPRRVTTACGSPIPAWASPRPITPPSRKATSSSPS